MKNESLLGRFFKARWSGCILGPCYGLFIYWWITYLVLKGPPFTDPAQDSLSLDNTSSQSSNESLKLDPLTSTTEMALTADETTKAVHHFKTSSSGPNITNAYDFLFSNSPPIQTTKYEPMMTVETRYI